MYRLNLPESARHRFHAIALFVLGIALATGMIGCETHDRRVPDIMHVEETYRMTTNGVPIAIRATNIRGGYVDVDHHANDWAEYATMEMEVLEGDGSRESDFAVAESAAAVRGGKWPLKRGDQYPRSVEYRLQVDDAVRGPRTHVVLVVTVDGREVTRQRVQVANG